MGNCWSRLKSSESMNAPNNGSASPSPPPRVTSLPTSGDTVPPTPMDPSLSTSASGDPVPPPPPQDPSLSSSGDHVSSPPPMDAMESVGERYKKIDPDHVSSPHMDAIESVKEKYNKIDPEQIGEQIGRLMGFIESQLHKMNTPSEAGSSSSEGWLATVRDVTRLAATTIDTICLEAEKLSKSYGVKEMRSVTMRAMEGMREMYWVFTGLSVAAYTVESYIRVCSREDECKELLLKILELAKYVKQYGEQMPDQRQTVCDAVGTIVEGAVVCLGYLKRGKFHRFWSAKTAAEQLVKTNQQLRDVRDSLLPIQKQSTMPLDQSFLQPHDFQGDKGVFLSHSGKQKNFLRQLHRDLIMRNVSCFFDEDGNSLPVGENFPTLIFKAVKRCKIAVLVISKEFIRSKWPMLELSAFINARNSGENVNLKLLPIFFMIRPEELSHITKYSAEWRELKVSNETRGNWQDALKEVRAIKGLHFGEGENEVAFRENVVKNILCLLEQINPLQLLDFKPVGIEEQVVEVKKLLDMEGAQSALAVIVCGFGGVGKSTLAASAVQSLDWSSSEFKFCWVAIDEKAPNKTSHIIKLQQDIIYNLEGVKLDFQNPDQGRVRIQEALKKKSSLLYIDNVVEKDYIRFLLPKDLSSAEQKTKLRIIITSRDKNVKGELNISCKEYDVMPLSDAYSQCLLSETIVPSKLMKDISSDEKHMMNEVATACRGVPLLLSVFGKHLRVAKDEDSYPKESYKEALGDLRKGNLDSCSDEDLGKTLLFVFDKIKDVEVKEAFLDICKYFHGWEWNLVADIVDLPKLEDLRRRMLVSKSGSGEVIVHDILRLMGMNKANLTRFSDYKELSDALENNLDSFGIVKDVKGISLVNADRLITIQSTKLEAMRQSLRVLMLGDWLTLDGSPSDKAFTNLRYLRVGDITVFPFKDPSKLDKLRVFLNRSKPGMNLSHLPSSLKRISHEVPDVECEKFVKLPFQYLGSLKSFIIKSGKSVELPKELHLPASLVDLHLNRCKNLPKDVGHLTVLESLILDRSDLERLPQGFGKLKKLKCLSMDYCKKLAFLSEELGTLSSLEALSIKYCTNLRALPESLGGLVSLQTLELRGCINLELLPESFGGLLSLEKLKLTECINLKLLPESFGALRIHSLGLHSLVKLQDLPNSLGDMPLLKDLTLQSCHSLMSLPDSFVQLKILETLQINESSKLSVLPEDLGRLLLKDFRLISCNSLMSLPNSFVQLKMLETLEIANCTKLSVLPEDFGRLRCLKHMTVEGCHLLKELPHGFGALPALKTFTLRNCDSFVHLPRDFGELTCLEELRLERLPLISRIPDGVGNLKKLRFLSFNGCIRLKTLPDDFENMATLERLSIQSCRELEGAMMEKILKLPNCYCADIVGSTKLSEEWEHMQCETEHPIVVYTGGHMLREAERPMRVALLHGKYMEVDNQTDQLVERSSLLVGLEEGTSATVALIMLPIRTESHQHQTLHQFVETARETAKANGSGELQIVCARKPGVQTPTEEEKGQKPIEEEERAEEGGSRQILVSLGEGSCAIPSTEYKRLKILTCCCDQDDRRANELSFVTANVVDIEGRKRFENFKFIRENEIRNPENSVQNGIQNFIESISREEDSDSDSDSDGREREEQSQSESVAGESATRELVEALKGQGIEYLATDGNRSKVAVDDLHGKTIGIISCDSKYLELIKLQQIYKDLQQKDSNFIAIWIPPGLLRGGHGSYTRLIQCMPWATIPHPSLLNLYSDYPRFVVVDEHGQIANRDAMPLLVGWGVKWYPFTQPTIRESLSSMESESCLEFLLHGMNIVGRKSMTSKATFLSAVPPNDWLKMERQREELTQIHGSFEVLYVGKCSMYNITDDIANVKQEYEDAIQDMRWPSLSFSDMIMFWYRCEYLASEEAYELSKESNIMMEKQHRFAETLLWTELVLVDKDGAVTGGGDDVVRMMRGAWDEGEGMAMRMVKEELSRGEWGPLVKTFFRDEIHDHPQHPIRCSTFHVRVCDVCFESSEGDEDRSYWCWECQWKMCGRCWGAYAKQEVEQLLLAKDN